MNPTLSCSYDKTTQELTVINPVTALSLGKPLSFRVSKIRNPYSARPRSDFWIRTITDSGYTIDASGNMTLTVSTYGTMKSGSFVRQDKVTTVSEPS